MSSRADRSGKELEALKRSEGTPTLPCRYGHREAGNFHVVCRDSWFLIRYSSGVIRTALIGCCIVLSVSCPPFLRGELPPALDATDLLAIETALHGLHMTMPDLAFKKDVVESQFILPQARAVLCAPLTLPLSGQHILANLAETTNAVHLVSFVNNELHSFLSFYHCAELPVYRMDSAVRRQLPAAVADAVERLVNTVIHEREYLKEAFSDDSTDIFAAAALDLLHLDATDPEIASWEKLGMDTSALKELLRRDENLELQDDELARTILQRPLSDKMMHAFSVVVRGVEQAIADLQSHEFTEQFQVAFDTPMGRVICGGVGPNVYTEEAFLIIDTGGDDVYENSAGGANGLAGRPISIVIDLGGNDRFVSRRSFSQGSGVFGIGILAALGSNCTFQAKHFSQGAGLFGCGLLMTGRGQQTFEADTFCQGAGMFGAGILWQRGGDTSYRAAQMAQGFGSTAGLGLLLDESGNDSYFAGGKYPCGWLPGHFFSLSQGFGYGMRPFAGGGIGILADLKGNDHYEADVYGQGASYWYSIGMLLDAEGNDIYQAYQYCQGAGIHLSGGLLFDGSGDDQYTAGHICQGAAHDYAVGILIDRAGNDRYTGDTTAQGSALNNSFALLLDRAGNDSYTGTDPQQSQASGHDGGKREYGSIALMLDLGGTDRYSQGQTNQMCWLKPWYGAGVDMEVDRRSRPTTTVCGLETGTRQVAASNLVGQALRLPSPGIAAGGAPALQRQDRLYQIAPVDPHHPIERLLRRSLRGGDTDEHRKDAEAAWAELKRRGTEALPYLLTRVDTPNVLARSKVEELIDFLSTNSVPPLIAGIDAAKNDEVARLCCYFLARFETATNAIPHVLPLLQREKTRGVAFYTLGHLKAREAFSPAMAALDDPKELVRLRAAQALGRIGDRRAISRLATALDDELWDIRYAAQDALVALGRASTGALLRTASHGGSRARPHAVTALAKLGDPRAAGLARELFRHEPPLIREALLRQIDQALQDARTKPALTSPGG